MNYSIFNVKPEVWCSGVYVPVASLVIHKYDGQHVTKVPAKCRPHAASVFTVNCVSHRACCYVAGRVVTAIPEDPGED